MTLLLMTNASVQWPPAACRRANDAHLIGHQPGWGIALFLASICLAIVARPSVGQAPRVAGETWPTEKLVLSDGETLQGLVENEDKTAVVFVEVRRPAGKPMFLIVHPIELSRVVKIERLDAANRQLLQQRLLAYRNRARIEAGRAEAVELRAKQVNGRPCWEYDTGQWFRLRTTLEEPIARRVVVRLEQVFSAYRQVLPPRHTEQSNSLTLVVYGTRAEYAEALREEGIAIRNPAFFEPKANRVCAGSSINELLVNARKAKKENVSALSQMEAWDRQFAFQLEQREQVLREQGMSSVEIARISTVMRRNWMRQQRELQRAVTQTQRRNRELVEQEIDAMLRLLFHESLHAYLANAVFPGDQYNVPNWLNEGLAQVFEAARIEADVMRIDAPDANRLRLLQIELARNDRLPLTDLLAADSQRFIAGHGSDGVDSDRHYLLAWGLAYYLAFERSVIGSPRMEKYVAEASFATPSVQRFERMVDEPAREFETAWIDAMLAKKPSPMR